MNRDKQFCIHGHIAIGSYQLVGGDGDGDA